MTYSTTACIVVVSLILGVVYANPSPIESDLADLQDIPLETGLALHPNHPETGGRYDSYMTVDVEEGDRLLMPCIRKDGHPVNHAVWYKRTIKHNNTWVIVDPTRFRTGDHADLINDDPVFRDTGLYNCIPKDFYQARIYVLAIVHVIPVEDLRFTYRIHDSGVWASCRIAMAYPAIRPVIELYDGKPKQHGINIREHRTGLFNATDYVQICDLPAQTIYCTYINLGFYTSVEMPIPSRACRRKPPITDNNVCAETTTLEDTHCEVIPGSMHVESDNITTTEAPGLVGTAGHEAY